jgi:two-component system chemotaxis response regulator CheB
MGKIRILVVDDSVTARRVLTRTLSDDPDLEVVGTAPNGRIALAKIPQLNPHLVILNLEMPERDGIQTLAAVRKVYPLMPVIIFSALTNDSAAATSQGLTPGATTFATMGVNQSTAADTMQRIRDELIPKVKMSLPAGARGSPPAPARFVPEKPKVGHVGAEVDRVRFRTDVLAIGVSTGGPNALAEILLHFPSDFPVPVLVVQHMPPAFTKLLAERLDSRCQVRVAEGTSNQRLDPGSVWIAPGDFHMTVQRRDDAVRIQIRQGPRENSCRPSVDVLFRSVAEAYGPHALAVVLTGMGQDGLRGCERIHQAGGQIIVQDEDSSIVWGMPGFVASAGLADKVLPLNQLGKEIVGRVGEHRPASTLRALKSIIVEG